MFRCQISIQTLLLVSENRSAKTECLFILTNQKRVQDIFDVIDTDAGLITPRTKFNCDGAYQKVLPSGKIIIKDLNSYGMLDLAGILAKSSNAGAGYASDRISDNEFYSRILSFVLQKRRELILARILEAKRTFKVVCKNKTHCGDRTGNTCNGTADDNRLGRYSKWRYST